MITSIFGAALGLLSSAVFLLCAGVLVVLTVLNPWVALVYLGIWLVIRWIRDGIRIDTERREANRPIVYDGFDPRLPSALED